MMMKSKENERNIPQPTKMTGSASTWSMKECEESHKKPGSPIYLLLPMKIYRIGTLNDRIMCQLRKTAQMVREI